MKMKAGMCLNALYMILLKWEILCVWMRLIWYYWYESLYVSESTAYDIIEMGADMCLNAISIKLLKW